MYVSVNSILEKMKAMKITALLSHTMYMDGAEIRLPPPAVKMTFTLSNLDISFDHDCCLCGWLFYSSH